jgi:hypothetical protein
MGWNMEELKPPPSKGVGKMQQKTIGLIVNHLPSRIVLPSYAEGLFQYDVDIDLDEESKKKKAERKAKDKDTKKPGKEKSPPKGKKPPSPGDDPRSPGREGKDPPGPTLWKKIVLHTVYKIEHREATQYAARNIPHPTKIATDGSKAMYTVHPIRCCPTGVMNIPVKVKDLGDDERGDDGYIVTVTAVKSIAKNVFQNWINNMHEFLANNQALPPDFVDVERIYNIALKTPALRDYTPVGRASFYPTPAGNGFFLGGGLESWTGFSLTYTMGWKPFVTVDVANTAFLSEKEVLDALYEVFQDARSRADVSNVTQWQDREFEVAEELLKTMKVSYVLQNSGQMLSRRVSGVSGTIAEQHTFECDGRQTNVKRYFEIDKQMRLRYPLGPCLMLGKSVVPAEFCTIVKGQVWKRKLTDTQTANMIKDTAKPPAERLGKIEEFVKMNKFNDHEVLQQFGVSVSDQLLVLQKARVLPPPSLIYQ